MYTSKLFLLECCFCCSWTKIAFTMFFVADMYTSKLSHGFSVANVVTFVMHSFISSEVFC